VQHLVRLELDQPLKKMVGLKTLLLLLLLQMLMTSGLTQQESMGTLFSPVDYGKIHFVHDNGLLDVLKNRYDEQIDEELKRLAQMEDQMAANKAKKFLWKV
jgi:Skp family chaperone for outer membrane proteins